MPFATLAIAALLSTAAAPTTSSSGHQATAVESQSNVKDQQPAPKEQRPTCCDQMRNCAGMHARSATHATDGASDAISNNGA